MLKTKAWAKIHKWLALLMAVQILFWFASGLFFSVVPIERVRGEHLVEHVAASRLPLSAAGDGLRRISASGAAPAQRVELRSLLSRPVALLTNEAERPRLYDLASGRLVSPIGPTTAKAVAEADQTGDARAVGIAAVRMNSPEYRGALPAWRVDFEDGGRRSVYVAADTGAVAARRSTLWRTYDFLWSLHIMDFKDHEDFNHPLLIVATALGLIVVLSGIVILPSRLGWTRRRRKPS